MGQTNTSTSPFSFMRSGKAFEIAKTWLPLAIGLLIVAIVGIVSTRTIVKSQDYQDKVEQSLVTVGEADAMMVSVIEMISAQRGQILSRSPAYERRYRDAKKDFESQFARMQARAGDGSVQGAPMQRLTKAVDARIEQLDRIELALAAGDYQTATTISVAARSETDAVRSAIQDIKRAELDLLVARSGYADSSARNALSLSVAGLAIAAMLVLISIIFVNKRSLALMKANEDIQSLANSLEARVAARTADLEDANEEIQRFAYIVSHDLRSPLVNIMGFTAELGEARQSVADYLAELGKTGSTNVPEDVRVAIMEDMPEAMGFIRTATSRMDRLIKAILQISREGRRALAPEPIDLNEMLQSLSVTLSSQLEKSDATLTITDLPKIQSDRLALEQVFANLLDNAIKYLRPGVPGEIEVSSETISNKTVVRITDNGRGVAEADRRRIFELFRRAGEQNTTGEGIGLAHVQALMRRLGGQIEVQSVLGEGTCFTVTLPLSMASSAK